MTREEFERRIEFKEVFDADGNFNVTGGISFRASMMIAPRFVDAPGVLDHAKLKIIHKLWNTFYEDRRKLLMDKFMALRRISYPSDFKECDRIYDEIYELLKGL